jgi:hypothetical protein
MKGDTLKDFACVYVDHVGQPCIDLEVVYRPDRAITGRYRHQAMPAMP